MCQRALCVLRFGRSAMYHLEALLRGGKSRLFRTADGPAVPERARPAEPSRVEEP